MRKFLSFIALLAVVVGSSVAVNFTRAADTTETIWGDTAAGENQPGWLFNRDAGTDTPFTFNTDAASIGDGSLYVAPISSNASDKFIGENFINSPIADIDSISYDFQIGTGGEVSDANHFYMNVYANFGVSDDLKYYDCRYDIVPTVGSTGGFTTVTFNPTQAYSVSTRGGAEASPFTCPAVPADMDSQSAGSNIRMFALNVGDTSASDEGLDGYLDKVVVDMGEDSTTYDFEPFVRSAEIISPIAGATITDGGLELEAVLTDDDTLDSVQWAVRTGTCAASTTTVAGNVSGHNTAYVWDGITFTSNVDVSAWADGSYCFIFNPTESTGDEAVRETVEFIIDNEGEPFERSGEITSPTSGEEITDGNLELVAHLTDEDGDDSVQWAVREGTCAAGTGTLLGNVDGHNDVANWDGEHFTFNADVSAWDNGDYCFVFNPSESAGDEAVRETIEFTINNDDDPEPTVPTTKDECKNGGWMDFAPMFKNQGQCVSYVATRQHLQ